MVQQPSLLHQLRVAIDPHRTPLVPRVRDWSSSQSAHREQGPVPIAWPNGTWYVWGAGLACALPLIVVRWRGRADGIAPQ